MIWTGRFIWILILTACCFSCSEFLFNEPIGRATENVFYNDAGNAELAVNACYDVLTWGQGPIPTSPSSSGYLGHCEEFLFGDILSDDALKGGSGPSDEKQIQEMKEWRATADLDKSTTLWSNMYSGIFRCNSVLANLPDSPIDENLKKRFMGETSFLRAYYYFYLVRIFGGVVLIDQPLSKSQAGKLPRSTVAETYAFIVNDLRYAASVLPERSDYEAKDLGRATRGAALGYLARVVMYQLGTDNGNDHSWEEVFQYTDTIIKSGQYSLTANYAEIFETEGENGPESVFEIQCLENPAGEDWGSIMGGTMASVFQGNREHWGWGFNNPAEDLVYEFGEKDPRLACTVYGEGDIVYGVKQKWYSASESPYLNRKAALDPALRPSGDGKDSPSNQRKIRFSDILLMNAEAAYYMMNETIARQRINQIRARARNCTKPKGSSEGTNIYEPYPAGAVIIPDIPASVSGRDLLEAIWKERRIELAMEGFRFWDLVRTGRYIDALPDETIKNNCRMHCIEGINIDGNTSYIPVLPIPRTEVESWNVTPQNPGY